VHRQTLQQMSLEELLYYVLVAMGAGLREPR